MPEARTRPTVHADVVTLVGVRYIWVGRHLLIRNGHETTGLVDRSLSVYTQLAGMATIIVVTSNRPALWLRRTHLRTSRSDLSTYGARLCGHGARTSLPVARVSLNMLLQIAPWRAHVLQIVDTPMDPRCVVPRCSWGLRSHII